MHNVAYLYSSKLYSLRETFLDTFHNTPLLSGLFLSCIPEFLERSEKKFVSACFSPDYYTALGLSSTSKAQI